MKPGDLVIARRGDIRVAEGTPVLVVDVAHSAKVLAVCILVDGRLIWVNGEMLEILNGSG